jgi:molybdopterin molybdotransferase
MSGEPDVSELLTVQQAIAVLDGVEVTPRRVRVPLAEARGLYLAEDLIADRDYPPFDKSLMDGYAVRAADVAGGPVELRVVGEVAAGQAAGRGLGAGEAIAIMTGAPIPPGADGVVPVEETGREGDRVRIVRAAANPGRFIHRRGADVGGGRVVLARGTRMEAAQIAVAATVGAHHVEVFAAPRVAVLSTGDELVDVGDVPGGAQIRNSNGPMLVALLRRLGCEVADLGVVRDDPKAIRAAMREGFEHDVLFVSGGMSMGTYDYVPRLLPELGFDLRITKLRIKPGKPFVFGVAGSEPLLVIGEDEAGRRERSWEFQHKYVFGLPGNPVSGFACTVRLASRLLTRLAGGQPVEKWVMGRLAAPLGANGPREFYQPAKVAWTAGGPEVTPLAWKGSADLFTLAGAGALLVRPEGEGPLAAGATVRVLEI